MEELIDEDEDVSNKKEVGKLDDTMADSWSKVVHEVKSFPDVDDTDINKIGVDGHEEVEHRQDAI